MSFTVLNRNVTFSTICDKKQLKYSAKIRIYAKKANRMFAFLLF